MSFYDLHVHTFLSDGVLGPGELARRGEEKGLAGLIFCDHVDAVTLESTVGSLSAGLKQLKRGLNIELKVGCELTHVSPSMIPQLAEKARQVGANFVVVHGETTVEPVVSGTNKQAVSTPAVDLLAHPGFITQEEIEVAEKNNVALEISARRGHSLTNGYLVRKAQKNPVPLVVNTDAHAPTEIITKEEALKIVRGSGHQDPQEVLQNNQKIFEEVG